MKQPEYGICYQCKLPIKIPGLDAYLCSQCGWVEHLWWKEYRTKKEKENKFLRKNGRYQNRKYSKTNAYKEDSKTSLLIENID